MALSKARSRLLQNIRRRGYREREGCVLVEGVRAATAALQAGAAVRFAVSSPRLATLDREGVFAEQLSRGRFELVVIDDGEFRKLTDTVTPQGVLLVCDQPDFDLAGTLEQPHRPAAPAGVLVADAIQDPANLSTMIRTAAAFGLRGLIALDGTVDPWSAKVVRGSAGSCFRIPIVRAPVAAAVEALRDRGIALLAADAAGADVAAVEPGASWALAIGNEGAGLRPEVRGAADKIVSVPLQPGSASLNAGVAAAILSYELARKGAR